MDTTAGVQLKNSLDATSLSPQQLWEAGICRPVLFKRNEGSKRLEKKKKNIVCGHEATRSRSEPSQKTFCLHGLSSYPKLCGLEYRPTYSLPKGIAIPPKSEISLCQNVNPFCTHAPGGRWRLLFKKSANFQDINVPLRVSVKLQANTVRP